MFNAVSDIARLLRIVTAFVSHGVLPYTGIFSRRFASKTYGQRVCLLFQSLGPTFIKFGQSLASRADIVGDDVAKSLLLLCDKMPPLPLSSVVKTIEGELNKRMSEVFLEFCEVPVATASIAQVHKAITLDGKIKAIKVLKPGIEAEFRRDINLMRRIGSVFGELPSLRRFKLLQLVDTFSSICKLELDLRFEAANADELRANIREDNTGFRVPEIDWERTTRRVLTLEWIDATPIYKVDELKDRDLLARNLVISFCNQVYRDRFFHADMHPGNLMVDSQNRIVAVDFGIMGRLDKETRFYITEIFLGFLNKDYKRVAYAHYDAGYVSGRREEFITACRAIWEPISEACTHNFSMSELLAQLFKITEDFNMEVQPKLLLLQKTMVLVEGICRQLSPEMNLWKVAEFWVKDHYEKYGFVDRFREYRLYKCARGVSSFMAKVEKSLDIIADHEKRRSEKKNTKFLFFIIVMLIGIILLKA